LEKLLYLLSDLIFGEHHHLISALETHGGDVNELDLDQTIFHLPIQLDYAPLILSHVNFVVLKWKQSLGFQNSSSHRFYGS